jgi:transcriptional regulator with XRE-family HTH domain
MGGNSTMADNMNRENAGSIVKAYRLAHLWTLQQVANMVRITASALYKIEAGQVRPTDLTLAKIRRAFPDIEAAA